MSKIEFNKISILLMKMELPNDIIGYLAKFLKPKRYTLLNKFYRDTYFRKNGLSVRSIFRTEWKNLLDTYNVKILRLDPAEGEEFEKYKKIAKNVTEIHYPYFSDNVVPYLKIRETFPNLVKLKYSIRASVFNINLTTNAEHVENILKFRRLKGTKIVIDKRTTNISILEKFANAGFPFKIYDSAYSKNLPPSICNGTKWVDNYIGNHIADISIFPNLEYIAIYAKNTRYTTVVEQIKQHPSVKKIDIRNNTIPTDITKNNGQIVKLVPKSNIFLSYPDINYTPEYYNAIKKYYNSILIERDDIKTLERFLDLERETVQEKRMLLYWETDIEHEKVIEILEYYDLFLRTSPKIIKFYLDQFKTYRLKMPREDDIRLIYKFGNEKLTIAIDPYNE